MIGSPSELERQLLSSEGPALPADIAVGFRPARVAAALALLCGCAIGIGHLLADPSPGGDSLHGSMHRRASPEVLIEHRDFLPKHIAAWQKQWGSEGAGPAHFNFTGGGPGPVRTWNRTFVNGRPTAAFPSWYTRCTVRGPFCDMRLNVKDQADYESRWAHQFLHTLSKERIAIYLHFFERMYHHVLETNSKRGTNCTNVLPFQLWVDHLRRRGFDVSMNGRLVANYGNSNRVQWKRTSDMMHHNVSGCSYFNEEPGWGTRPAWVEHRMGPHQAEFPEGLDKYMWTEKKGRGIPEDLASMVMNIDRSDVTAKMGIEVELAWLSGRGESEHDRGLPTAEQHLLPSQKRWNNGYKNHHFGIYSYGDEPDWFERSNAKSYFFEGLTHGMGILYRNLTRTSPADRQLDAGMPFVGGGSGSLTDLHLAARDLGYSGLVLAELKLVACACLIAGGHHSLFDLLISAVDAERQDIDSESFTRSGEQITYFGFPLAKELIQIMNLPESEYQSAQEALASKGGLPKLYGDVVDEFIQRVGPEGLVRGESTRDKMSKAADSLAASPQCLNQRGASIFLTGVYKMGGLRNAFEASSPDGVYVSADAFVRKLLETWTEGRIYSERAVSDVFQGQSLLSKEAFDAYVSSETLADTTHVHRQLQSLREYISSHLWPAHEGLGLRTATDFRDAYWASVRLAVSDLYDCLAEGVSRTVSLDQLRAFYYRAWLDHAGHEETL